MERRLKLVASSEAPPVEKVRQRIKAAGRPASVIECRCGSRELIQAKQGMLFKDGRASGGTTVYLCVNCLLRGERVVLA